MSNSFATPQTVAHKAPLSMEFSRQEYWSGLPFLPPGDLPNPGTGPVSPALAAEFFTTKPLGKPSSQLCYSSNISNALLSRYLEELYISAPSEVRHGHVTCFSQRNMSRGIRITLSLNMCHFEALRAVISESPCSFPTAVIAMEAHVKLDSLLVWISERFQGVECLPHPQANMHHTWSMREK